ncbi:hypothetical protein ACN20G_33315 (plasmid) [Streptomyces sp. BI20]|uniref:hypothetical protein n=1 Tax=Streptomyces sp. BI20 TaxID=3403460 RepID=UPI003C77981D
MTMTDSPSIWDAAHTDDARRPRSRQTALGASDTICQRRAGYILAGAPRDNPHADKRRAILGTYIHTGLLESARREDGWLVEKEVSDGVVRGHIDAVHLDAETAARVPKRHRPRVPADVVTVEDIKTKSLGGWDRVVRFGATAAEMRQVLLYVDLLRRVGFADIPGQRYLHRLGPLNVQAVRFRFICRDTGAEHVQTIPIDEWLLEQARWWVERVHEAGDPEDLRRDHDGPGLSAVCDNCPFVRSCWPEQEPGTAPQTILVQDDEARAEALAEYVAAHERWRRADAAKKLIRKTLDSAPEGIYGENSLRWTGGKEKEEVDVQAMVDAFDEADLTVPMTPDTDRMIALMKAAGLVVPMRPSRKRTTRAISISPAPQAPSTAA